MKNFQYIAIKFAFCVIVFSTILLNIPDYMLYPIEVASIIDHYRGFIGLSIVLSTIFVVISFFNYFIDLIYSKMEHNIKIKRIRNKLQLLNLQERSVLREFFLRGSPTLLMPKEERIVKSLLKSDVLEVVSTDCEEELIECRIGLVARSILTRSQLMLPENQISNYELDSLFSRRPYFVNMIKKPREIFKRRAN